MSDGRPDPVFVLCMGRSGSTLLRFMLDAHPDLACPPETSLPALCGQLAVVWSLIEGAPLSPNRGDAPPKVPDAAIAGIRHMIDMMTESYLARRKKKQFCDKSLGSASFAELLLRIYPAAKFICLYRHPLDMIHSGLEACPWGLNGYGFDQYISESPGNAVLALARYWLDNASRIVAFEEAHPNQCFRVRYEDLATDPESIVQTIYRFIGVPEIPGITRDAFGIGLERSGPADHKIWATPGVTTDSVGRGESVPVGLIAPPIADGINNVVDGLGYRPIDEQWGTPAQPTDPRLPETINKHTVSTVDAGEFDAQCEAVGRHLNGSVPRADGPFMKLWKKSATDRFAVVCRANDARGTERGWVVDLLARTVSEADPDEDDHEWTILGSPGVWTDVISGRVNLLSAMRRFDLRYCTVSEEEQFSADTRIGMLTNLLGLAAWQSSDSPAGGRQIDAAVVA